MGFICVLYQKKEAQSTECILVTYGKFLERGLDEGRTNKLKVALDNIWDQIDPWKQLFKRKSLAAPEPTSHRDRQGRFASPKAPASS